MKRLFLVAVCFFVFLAANAAMADDYLITGVIATEQNGEQTIIPRAVTMSEQEMFRQMMADPLGLILPQQQAYLDSLPSEYVIIPKEGYSFEEVAGFLAALGVKDVVPASIGDIPMFSGAILVKTDNVIADRINREPWIKNFYRNNLVFLDGDMAGFTEKYAGPDNPDTLTARGNRKVVVGVVDTGVSKKMRGANYAPGPESTRFATFIQPDRVKHNFKFKLRAGERYINYTVFWPGVFGSFPQSDVDIDLYLKDSHDRIVIRAKNRGSVPPSERIEYDAGLSDKDRTFTAEMRIVSWGNSPVFNYPAFGVPMWANKITMRTEVASHPRNIEVMLGDEIHQQPPDGFPSWNNTWKVGYFTLRGKRYQVTASDMYDRTQCAGPPEYDQYKQYIFVGVGDGFSIRDMDTNTEVTKGVGECVDTPYGKMYQPPQFNLGGATYQLNYLFNVSYELYLRFGSIITPQQTLLGNDVISFTKVSWNSGVFGPADTTYDFLGHGTGVAGIVVDKSYGSAKIYNAKAFGSSYLVYGVCSSNSVWTYCVQGVAASTVDIINALHGAVDHGAKVINASFSAHYSLPIRCSDLLMSQYIQSLVDSGVVVVASAGNYGTSSPMGAPACIPDVITVGAVATSDLNHVTDYSQRGSTLEGVMKPDVVAEGGDDPAVTLVWEHIANLSANGKLVCRSKQEWSRFGVTDLVSPKLHKMSGTSFSAPEVSALVARMLAKNRHLTPAQIKEIIMSTTDDLGYPLEVQGAGRINPDAALVATPDS
ncbi:MAG: hypothetical protein A2750_02845 [Candidatus Yanofskybacteria bacterium RIFCSPHIGHO2_01_FULL_45_42]|uniref:Peptidase S8/S53 domain-containing protein n=2 Tax=Candidatus Yanofskyibacteriota TaxID=1752733 RepID=A0A1F8F170_9BACT|nr:MAG: hypothetical protein A2750_02845 [Candidatus Yanofskybacteria bacterium RIFCSPHIGHO2_01_FULL_45_42]OGN16460.1 MAG: hypothetical protein A3C81_00640 [Candidatus Yanofskybacteria bacterium RIFCSPHIGHO2_02_FULL_46_19]